MHAEIFPRAKALLAPPEDEVLAEKPRRPDLSCLDIGTFGDHVPIVQ